MGIGMTPEELKAFRVEQQLCQGSLAERLGIARTTLVGYERGHTPVPKMLVLAVAALNSDAPPYSPPPELLRKIRSKQYKRINGRIRSEGLTPA